MCEEARGCRENGEFSLSMSDNRATVLFCELLAFRILRCIQRQSGKRMRDAGEFSGFFLGRMETPGMVFTSNCAQHIPNLLYAAPPTLKNIFLRRQNQVAVSEKIRIRLKSYDHTLVDSAAEKIVETAKRNGATVSGPIPLPTEKEIITILRAVHKYKDSREQFEYRTHKRLIDVIKPSQKTIEALTSLELPAGVEIEIKL